MIPLAIPPLRERGDDILELVEHFSEQFLQRSGQAKPRWRADALQLLRDYPWPGNVRELANIVERLAILHPGSQMTGQQVEDVLIVDRDEDDAVTTPTRPQERVGGTTRVARYGTGVARRQAGQLRTNGDRARAGGSGRQRCRCRAKAANRQAESLSSHEAARNQRHEGIRPP